MEKKDKTIHILDMSDSDSKALVGSIQEYVPSLDEPYLYPYLLLLSTALDSLTLPCEPMIDSGYITVMIRPEFANAISLKHYSLKQPKVFREFKEIGARWW